jgi:hypothetical protein
LLKGFLLRQWMGEQSKPILVKEDSLLRQWMGESQSSYEPEDKDG